MLRGFLTTARRWLDNWSRALAHDRVPSPELFGPAAPRNYRPVERVVLADAVADTLFDDFARHRGGPRGEEEVGWVLLGLRDEREVTVLATLPAGADRQAGVAHVHFNSMAQAVASRIVRQRNRRLSMVGVVHTHPGSLRHPSDGDYQGDSLWVSRLRGCEGVFGIGTADARPPNGKAVTYAEHMQARDELCFSWYALGAGDRRYRRLPVTIVPGPDLARPLHPLWDTIELHAMALDGLCQQLTQVSFETGASDSAAGDAVAGNAAAGNAAAGDEAASNGAPSAALVARLPLPDKAGSVRILLHGEQAQFFLDREDELTEIHPEESQLDRAVFLVLAELARQRHSQWHSEQHASERHASERHASEQHSAEVPLELLCKS
jgi:proteasome lid subunit RPN8/RPN11